jgi:glutamyl-tRNA synthetase/nondiscriminating glutamyl-tRNA synthetase
VLSRYAARDVLRQLALLLLEGAALNSDRLKEIITALKEGLDIRGRELFHPIRLALAGRAGEGELDRVILLLDEAAGAAFAAPVKSARVRILEFCAALD